MSIFKDLIQSIGSFFERLFNNTRDDFNDLPKEQQNAIIQGVNISQIIKEQINNGAEIVINEISSKLNISPEVSMSVVLKVSQDMGFDTGDIQKAITYISDTVQSKITDNGYNSLWQDIAQFAAHYMATGKLNWITLGLGVVEFAYQHFIKKVK